MFFQDNRSIGVIFWMVVILLLFNAAMVIASAFDNNLSEFPDYVTDRKNYCILTGAGSLISALIYGVIAHRVMSVNMARISIVRSYVMTVGLTTTIGGVFAGLATYQCTDQPLSALYITIASVALGVLVLLMSIYISKGRKGFLMKVIWIVIVAALILMAVNSLLPAENWWTFAQHVANLLIAFFMLMFITDENVRKEMGVTA